MSQGITVEDRIAALEKEVAELRRRIDEATRPQENWLQKMAGSMKDNPAFPEAMALAAAWRRADRPAEEP
jgi:hypothetical protein